MQQTLFQVEQFDHPKLHLFKQTSLGQIHQTIPWEALSSCLPRIDKSKTGPKPWFTNQGMLALMFLKHLLDTSDEKLIERFNTDWSLQLFCGKLLSETEKVRDTAILSKVRGYVADQADWQQLQAVLLSHWKDDMDLTALLLMDATVYESYIRFPTDVKLLWESCIWGYQHILFKSCKLLKIKRPRNKFIDQKRKQQTYFKLRKKSYKKGRKRHTSLLYLLRKGLDQLQQVLDDHPNLTLTHLQGHYLRTIKKVLMQQQKLALDPKAKIADRIVSLHKPYIRTIKTGKENKPNEWGMKAHMLQCDGVSWFDCMQFNPFNECKRLKITVAKHKQAFGHCHQLAADRIYATNENRRYLSEKQIFHGFVTKGRQPKDHNKNKAIDVLKSQINKVRSTHLEGAFGNHKNHYGLRKVKALREATEKTWVFFGVMAANAVLLTKRRRKPPPEESLKKAA